MSVSRRELLQATGAAALLPLLTRTGLAAPKPKRENFRAVFFSDTHVAVGRNIEENRQMLAEISALKPDFCINGGDVTDQAWRAQFDLYKGLINKLGFPIHHCPGNHDVRWAPLGMQIFSEYFESPYRAFEHKGVWFILLNSAVPLSHWGNIPSPQMAWLEKTLQAIGPTTPIFLFSHHWVGREDMRTGRPTIQIDNEPELIEMIRGYNVRFIGNGHGHSDLMWEVEGAPAIMNRGLYQFSYTVLDVDWENDVVEVRKRTAERPKLTVVRQVRLTPLSVPQEFAPKVLADTARAVALDRVITRYQWNDGVWMQPLRGSRITGVPAIPGYQNLTVRGDHPKESKSFEIERTSETGFEKLWETKLPGGVMSQIILHGDRVLVSMMDGTIASYEEATGREIWSFKTGGYCHSTPCVSGDRVFVGSADGFLYALSLQGGTELWKVRLPGPVYASPAVAKGTVFVANFEGFFGFDEATGKQKWRTAMPPSNTPFSQSVPVTDGERFIQGAWDSHVYALEAETGRQVWRQACQERTFAFSPAIGAPFLSDGFVYIVANGNGLFKFNAATGEKMWEVASTGQKYGHSGPCVVGDRVFAGNLGDGEGEVRCASAADGKEIWMARTGLTIYDSCARAGDGFVAIHSVPGVVNALAQVDGKLLGQYRLGRGHALSTPAVRGDRVYAASFSRRLVALRLRM